MKILDRLREAWRSFKRGAPEVVTKEVPAPREPIPWAKITAALNAPEPRTEIVPYKPLLGVVPDKLPTEATGLTLAMDGGAVEPARMAMDYGSSNASWGYTANGALGPGLAFLGFPYLAELLQLTEYRTPCESLANEMTRRWGKVKNKGKEDKTEKIHQITERMEQLKVRDVFREGAFKTEGFGRAHLAINIKGQDNDVMRQLPLTTIEKGTLLGFQCIEPYWMTPYSWNSTNPRAPDFYKPQSWFELGKKTHSTRYLTFVFREVPDLLKPAYDFSGISMLQLMMPYVNRWYRTAKNVNDLINIFSIVTLMTDLQSLVQETPEFLARLEMFTKCRDNRGVMALNKDTEELAMQNVPLSSLDKLQAQAQEHMATPARMPLIEFFGITPTGLTATSEGEFQARNKYVKGMQELGYGKHIERVLHLVQMDLFGAIDEDITWEWLDLFEPTGKEQAEIAKADADRDAVYIQSSVVSPDEVREKLQMNPESGYDGLEGPAPEPTMWAENEESGGEEKSNASGKNDKDR